MKKRRTVAALTALCFLLCMLSSGCNTEEPTAKRSGVFLNTVVTVTLYGTDDSSLLDDCFEQIRLYEGLFDRFDENSDIARLNASNGEAVTVSKDTANLLTAALRYGALSNGAFDVTVAPVMDLWPFTDSSKPFPIKQDIQAVLPLVNYQKLTVSGTTAQLSSPQSAVDVGGIAKGYIADRLAEYLREKGVMSALLDLGGNIYALGDKNGREFTVGVRDPDDAYGLSAVLSVKDCSVVTSGDYERYTEKDGVRYHHLIDPKTGYPADSGLRSVTVVSPHSVDGDALSTACFVLGLDKGLALIESLNGIEALFIAKDGTLIASSGLSYQIR